MLGDHYTGLWQRAEPSFLLPDVAVGTNDISQLDRQQRYRSPKILGNNDISQPDRQQRCRSPMISGTNDITQLDRATKILAIRSATTISGFIPGYPDIFHILYIGI